MGLILLLVILFVLYILLIALCPPRPVDECLTGSLLTTSPQIISNGSINAVINTTQGPYNLIFAGNTTVFTYNGSVIRAPDNRVWTRIEQDNGGYVRLDSRREGDATQEWISSDGTITSPDGNYYVTLNRSGGVWYPQLTTLKDKVSCQFRFTNV